MPQPPRCDADVFCLDGFELRFPLLHAGTLGYGTSGFRTEGSLLPPIGARVALIAVLRVWWYDQHGPQMPEYQFPAHGGHSVGMMITASHNPAADNGIKLIDVDGGMMASSWEVWCTRAANAATDDALAAVIRDCVLSEGISVPTSGGCSLGVIQLGCDTRSTGKDIVEAIQWVLDHVSCVTYTYHGVVTTPQQHFLVHRANGPEVIPRVDFNVGLYERELLGGLRELLAMTHDAAPCVKRQRIVVDTANGVGFFALQRLLQLSESLGAERDVLGMFFDFILVDTHADNPASLNHECGADFTQKRRSPSAAMANMAQEMTRGDAKSAGEEIHFYSLDGDADRVVAFSYNAGIVDRPEDASWVLLDGDRISILYAMLLRQWLGGEVLAALDVGVVQTGYANGASTAFVRDKLGIRTYVTATGVKHLHPIAHARDIGVYFEANGHGTVLFNKASCEAVASRVASGERDQMRRLIDAVSRVLSQVCGDAIADMLLCEVALRALHLGFAEWAHLFADLPSLQVTVAVSHPSRITTTPDESRALTPCGLQEEIDAAVQAVASKVAGGSARCFVRPSGTEPVVRVYAEAPTADLCASLVAEVSSVVVKYCSIE